MIANIQPPKKADIAVLPTRLQYLKNVSQKYGREIYIKRDDLTGFVYTGNKIRKLEYILPVVLDGHYDCIITCGAVGSNHARTVAALCAEFGLDCYLFLREDGLHTPKLGNDVISSLMGASIEYVDFKKFNANITSIMQSKAMQLKGRQRKPFLIPVGGKNSFGLWGYIEAFQEIIGDIDAIGGGSANIYCPSGTGGTQAGLAIANHLDGNQHKIIGLAISDDEDYFKKNIVSEIRDWEATFSSSTGLTEFDINIDVSAVFGGYGDYTKDVVDMIRFLASSEGILLDPTYTGKAFLGMINRIRNEENRGGGPEIFIHTGGGFQSPYKLDLLHGQ